MPQDEINKLPLSKWRGKVYLGGAKLGCYILDNETHLVSSDSTTKAIADVERVTCRSTSAQIALNPIIDKD